MLMVLKVLQYNFQGMNRLFDVERQTKSFGQRFGSEDIVDAVTSLMVLEDDVSK